LKTSEKENCNEKTQQTYDEPRALDGASGWRRYFDVGGKWLLRSELQWRLPLPVLQEVGQRSGRLEASHF
jgi:hypothetical protein